MGKINQIYKKYKKPHMDKLKVFFWLKVLNYLSVPMTLPFLNTSVTPNQITIVWFILGIIFSFFFFSGDYISSIIGIILINIVFIIDGMDGIMARFKNMMSDNGAYLESIAHTTIEGFLILNITFGAFYRYGNPLIFLFGFMFMMSIFLNQLIYKEKIELFVGGKIYLKFKKKQDHKHDNITNNSFLPKLYENAIVYFHTDFFLFLLIILAITDKLYVFILFYGVAYPLLILFTFIYENKRGYGWIYEFYKSKGMMK